MDNMIPVSKLKGPFFDALLTHSKESVIILDNRFNVLLFNRYAEKLFSINETNAVQKSFKQICSQSNVIDFIKPCISKAPTKKSLVIPPSTDTFGLSWIIDTIKYDNSNFYLLMTKGLEEKKNQNEILKLETLIENMPCNVYWMDKNCIMMGCNQNVLNMLGITKEEFRGKSYEELSKVCNWPEG